MSAAGAWVWPDLHTGELRRNDITLRADHTIARAQFSTFAVRSARYGSAGGFKFDAPPGLISAANPDAAPGDAQAAMMVMMRAWMQVLTAAREVAAQRAGSSGPRGCEHHLLYCTQLISRTRISR